MRKDWCSQCGQKYVGTNACGPTHAVMALELESRVLSDVTTLDMAATDVQTVMAEVGRRCDRLREYAVGLREWAAKGDGYGINPWHVANGIERIANEISSSKSGSKDGGK